MAENIDIFDETTGRSKTIAVTFDHAVLNSQPDGAAEYYLRMTTSARDSMGASLTPLTITSDSDLVLGTTQFDGVTVTPYNSYTDAIQDYTAYMKSLIDFSR